MNWWGWILGGAILLGAELLLVDAQFYLVFVGGSAILVGLLAFAVPPFPVWAQWAGFAILTGVSLSVFRSRLYGRLRGRAPSLPIGPVGATIRLPVELAPGASCRVEHSASHWTAVNDGKHTIPAGANARIVHVSGLSLMVRQDD